MFDEPTENPDADLGGMALRARPDAPNLNASFNAFADRLTAGHRISEYNPFSKKWYTRFATKEEIADIRTRPYKK